MKWHEGSIADAVTLSKSRNAIFVVYVEGDDQLSSLMNEVLNDAEISKVLETDQFVSVKVLNNSESYRQFVAIYKLVPIPSLFFIGENGLATAVVFPDTSKESLTSKINSAIKEVLGSEEPEVSNTTASTEGSSSSAMEAGSDVAPTSSTEVQETDTSSELSEPLPTPTSSSSDLSNEVPQKDRIQELLQKRRDDFKKQEEEKERQMEISRRKQGKEINIAKRSQLDKELENCRREREKEKREDALARERVLRDIEEDRAARAKKQELQGLGRKPAVQSEQPTVAEAPRSNLARIQFKLPSGKAKSNVFPPATTVRELRHYIDANMDLPFRDYSLTTAFPKRQFTDSDIDKDLNDLDLVPSAVIHIVPVQGNNAVAVSSSWLDLPLNLLWSLLQPLWSLASYSSSLLFGQQPPGGRAEANSTPTEPSPQQPNPSGEPPVQPSQVYPPSNFLRETKNIRKRGNIHSLRDADDSNDENNTWNGNSTQLM